MKQLESYSLLLVGKKSEKVYFERYFKDITLLKTNKEALETYLKKEHDLVFLYCSQVKSSSLSTAKEIRKYSRKTIIVIISEKESSHILIEALPLHLSGYLEKPFEEKKVKLLLQNIANDLKFIYASFLNLKDGFTYDIDYKIVYDRDNNEVKLTKNERTLMELFISNHNRYISSEEIEHTIWEDTSLTEDCNKRLKHLIYGLRKKLPKDSIDNCYTLGYKLVSYL